MQLASSVVTRAARLAPRRVIPSTPKPAPKIPGTLPCTCNPSTALWHHDSGETSSIKTVRDETELAQLLAATRPSSLVVVKFGEARCKASKVVEEKFKQTAAEFAECDKTDVQFASVDSGSNWLLCQKMGIRSVPHVQIFSGFNGKIADFSLAPPEYDTLDALLGERRDSMLAWKRRIIESGYAKFPSTSPPTGTRIGQLHQTNAFSSAQEAGGRGIAGIQGYRTISSFPVGVMAYRELQGRLQLAERQVRMYREAMEHLIAAPPAARPAASQPSARPIATTAGAAQESLSKISAGGDNYPGATEPAPGAVPDVATTGGAKAESVAEGDDDSVLDHGRGKTKKEVPRLSSGDAEGAESSAGSTAAGKGPNIWGFIGGAVGWIGEGTAGWMAQSEARREHHRLLEEVGKVRRRRAAVWRERELLAKTRAELARCRADLLSRRIALDSRRSDVAEARQNCRSRKALYSEQLVSAMRMGALNDCFHIWHQGPFGTINGFRVGRLNTHVVDWQEVNAGVGQAAIVLVTVAMAMGVEFSKYLIAPCGSFTKIARSEDGRVLYSLHTDESFSLFPRRNFNFALKAFLHCLGEVGDHVQEHDPTLRLPYHIKEKEGTVGGLPVALGSSYEDWTRALKYMLTDLKWIAAWAAKYLPPC